MKLDFKQRLKNLRKEKNITQVELGKILNVSKQTISGYENGASFPPQDILDKLTRYFDVSSDYILCKTNIKKPQDIDEGFAELLNDPELLVAFKDLMNLSDSDKQEIINYIKFKKNRTQKSPKHTFSYVLKQFFLNVKLVLGKFLFHQLLPFEFFH